MVSCAPEEVAVAEYEQGPTILLNLLLGRGLRILGLGNGGAQIAPVGKHQICDELYVDSPVSRIVKNQDRGNLEAVFKAHLGVFGAVDGLRQGQDLLLVVKFMQVMERENLGTGLEDVSRRHDRLETVAVCDVPCLGGIRSKNKHCGVAECLELKISLQKSREVI